MLSKMDTNMLSSRCDRSIIGEQFSKMNSISTVSQYKCHKLRRTWDSSSPIPYSEVYKSELAFKRSSRSRKALFTRTTTPGKTLLLYAKSATLWNYAFFKPICSHSCSLLLQLQKANFNAVTENKSYIHLHILISQTGPKYHSTWDFFPTMN